MKRLWLSLLAVGCAHASTRPFTAAPHVIPGVIEAEQYDEGPPEKAYHDVDEVNRGVALRGPTQVDIEKRPDASGGHGIGWTKAGEWLVYTVEVKADGLYTIEIPVASKGQGGTFHLEFDGVDRTGPIQVPDTGAWTKLSVVSKPGVHLEAGRQRMRAVMDTEGVTKSIGDIDLFRFRRQADGLRAGVARAPITPTTYGWMTGYASRNKVAEGVDTELVARALALEDGAGHRLVVVTAEILGFPPTMSAEIKAEAQRRFGITEAELMLVGSHTHAGPVLPERPSPEIFHGLPPDETVKMNVWSQEFQRRVLEIVGQALARLEPAQLRYTRTRTQIGVNRRKKDAQGHFKFGEDREAPRDDEVPVLWVETSEGQARAVVFTVACHDTTIGGDYYRYHGDWSGVAQSQIEGRLGGGAVALFVTGTGADINPSPRGKVEHVLPLAKAVTEAVMAIRTSGQPVQGTISAAFRRIDLTLAEPPSRELLTKELDHKAEARRRHARVMLSQLDAGTLPKSVPFPIQVWKIGELTLVALGGETCVDYGLRLRRELGPNLWVAGYANEVMTYIPSERVLEEGGYEAGWDHEMGRTIAAGSMTYYGYAGPFAPGLEEQIVSTVRQLVSQQ